MTDDLFETEGTHIKFKTAPTEATETDQLTDESKAALEFAHELSETFDSQDINDITILPNLDTPETTRGPHSRIPTDLILQKDSSTNNNSINPQVFELIDTYGGEICYIDSKAHYDGDSVSTTTQVWLFFPHVHDDE